MSLSKIIRDIIALLQLDEEDYYYEPVRTGNAFGNKYIKYESNGDKNKKLSIEDYLHKIRPHLKDIINNLKGILMQI